MLLSKSDFRGMQLAFLGAAGFIILLPIFSPFMSRHFPGLWRCGFKALTGGPCPFCGITGDVLSIIKEGKRPQHPFTVPLLFILLHEIIIRPVFLVAGECGVNLKTLLTVDLAVHIPLILFVLGYVILFFVE